MVKSVDTRDLKSLAIQSGVRVQFPPRAPILNLSAQNRRTSGRHEVPPTALGHKQSRFAARRLRRQRRLFRRGGGATSEAILLHSICFDTKSIFVCGTMRGLSIQVFFVVRTQRAVLDSLGSPELIAPRRLFECLLSAIVFQYEYTKILFVCSQWKVPQN